MSRNDTRMDPLKTFCVVVLGSLIGWAIVGLFLWASWRAVLWMIRYSGG